MASEAGWELRTNFKDKPTSQGTLFQGGKDQLNPERRYPRGYTPQRQREVSEAVPESPTVSDRAHHPRVIDAVARSTVPTGDLRGLREIHDRPKEGTAGTYWSGNDTIGVDMTREGSDGTLIHEIGHRTDHVRSVLRHKEGPSTQGSVPAVADQYASDFNKRQGKTDPPSDAARMSARTSVRRGVSEAIADNYFVEHHRSKGRDSKQPAEGIYQGKFRKNELDVRYPGYAYVRPHQNLGPQWHQEVLF